MSPYPRPRNASVPSLVHSKQSGSWPVRSGLERGAEILDLPITGISGLCEERYPETASMRQVKGVGALTSLAFVLTVEDPGRFAKSRSVGAYVGLRPRSRQSGEQRPQLRITKAGDALLRRYLVTAAQYILGPFGPDTELRRFGLRLAERGGKAAKKRAVVAVARKLAVLLHRLWLTGEAYEPLGYGQLERKAA